MDILAETLSNTISPAHLLIVLIGTFLGQIVGALPGLGAVVAITICLPFTFGMKALSAMGLLMGVYCGSICGGSIAAILVNTPGTPAAAASVIDGHALAKAGKADQALGWSLAASVFGGIFSCFILSIAAPQIAAFALKFGPLEIMLLISLGLTCIISVSSKNLLKGLVSGICGLLLACVGISPFSTDFRFTFDLFTLNSGFDLIAVIVGIFALSEVIDRAERMRFENRVEFISCRVTLPSLAAWKGRIGVLFRGSIIGTIVGILPGTGAATACFIAYGDAQGSSPRKERIGTGEPDGIIAPESANNAVTGGALIPALSLGIPGDAVTAVMLASFILHGITPGVRLMHEQPAVIYSTFALLLVANLFMVPTYKLTARLFGMLMRLPEQLFLGLIIILCMLGSYGARGNWFDVLVTVMLGFVGYIMRRFGFPAAPLVIGMVLGQEFEVSLGQTLLYKGELPWLTYILQSPIAMVLIAAIAAIVIWPNVQRYRVTKAGSLNAPGKD